MHSVSMESKKPRMELFCASGYSFHRILTVLATTSRPKKYSFSAVAPTPPPRRAGSRIVTKGPNWVVWRHQARTVLLGSRHVDAILRGFRPGLECLQLLRHAGVHTGQPHP